ncbi:type II toxin-antitoxin system death-on-curing family toxin [Roseomonas stagni]|uniref:Type II toxin-antitoxin system death-on-curing family toxin n=1 Tax=Falsiroseomonas algicola TaxID=2716930 RepID=A0A6M1LMW7_9PROT|nr:type II toxin-antitoxin system death-on-curing family toxin [Falsiroseomonas algicola]NGM21705.1 type II toxin-antitoxin system death-on-curing family toxin [Falsiroseomonas algicola]
MTTPRWIDKRALLYLHSESLRQFGGAEGLRDEGLLDSALARPLNRHAYEAETDLCRLAASYAHGIVRNHPFVDGNKRAAFLAAGVFLMANGLDLVAPQPMATVAMLDLAAGEFTEEEFAAWLRDHTAPRA